MSNITRVDILPFSSALAADFKRLNVEWLEKHFYVEEIDNLVLSNPIDKIITPGGHILFARYAGEIVGTGALMLTRPGVYELTKMAVTEGVQGLGIGRRLLDALIALYQQQEVQELLFLESNSGLATAIGLYERSGFVHRPNPGDTHYERADVYMEYQP